MSPDVYLIWFRDVGDKQDNIVGVAYRWEHAKTMAENLYSIQKGIDKKKVVSTGVSLFECGDLYTRKQPKSRWQVLPIMAINAPSW
jgi:hypothetical protein